LVFCGNRKAHLEYNRVTGSTSAWEDLGVHFQESNRAAVRSAILALLGFGYRLQLISAGSACIQQVTNEERLAIESAEHDRWLREKLLDGWPCAPNRSGPLRLNPSVVTTEELDATTKRLDFLPTETVLRHLGDLGYVMAPKEP
jgi:hypothetical protein